MLHKLLVQLINHKINFLQTYFNINKDYIINLNLKNQL